jgi:transcriptional regulator with XRE-family HTH domain
MDSIHGAGARRAVPSGVGLILPFVGAMTERSFVVEVPTLLRERGWSIRELARRAGVTDAHLSRVLRRASYKTPSGDLASRVASAFGLPVDYFPEFREAYVVEALRKDPQLRDDLYRKLRGESPA